MKFQYTIPRRVSRKIKVGNVEVGGDAPITVQTMTTRCSTGTCTLTAKKNTTAITGLANSVSTTEVTNTASSGNVFAVGNDLRLTVSSLSGAENVWFNVKFERTLP